MMPTRLVVLTALAALALAVSACSRTSRTPCGKLAAEICDNGSAETCTAFVDRQMTPRHAQITNDHKQVACQTVLDDAPTVAALQRAFETRDQAGSGGDAKKGSASK